MSEAPGTGSRSRAPTGTHGLTGAHAAGGFAAAQPAQPGQPGQERAGHVLVPLAEFAAWPQQARDAAYDNTAAVATSAQQLAALEVASAELVQRAPCQLDLAYGPGERQRFDVFAGPPGSATLVFIHGGYWQMRHKNTFRAVVAGALAQGLGAALVGYTLAPQASLTRIVGEVREAVRAVRAHAQAQGASGRLLVSGWSAGAHLAALCLDEDGVAAGLGVSGIYDLAPIRLTYLNTALQLSDAEVAGLSPLHRPLSSRPFVVAHGLAELPALQAQSRTFAAQRRAMPGGMVAAPGADHFSVLQALAQPQGQALQAVLALL
ncbi:esterase [Comamonas serinivorans]|uniref:Esterase n=1 Tax=Comamonas serinivorans TaxID=1082851 RepID=A0A1Y0ENG5_9BURK|nr:alpha/beta hydrolase [Comamonas serinivorans]ARU04842.1 esterase [Comamonas serinivorans]